MGLYLGSGFVSGYAKYEDEPVFFLMCSFFHLGIDIGRQVHAYTPSFFFFLKLCSDFFVIFFFTLRILSFFQKERHQFSSIRVNRSGRQQ